LLRQQIRFCSVADTWIFLLWHRLENRAYWAAVARWLDRVEEFAVDVILERRYGKRAALLRWFLYGLSHLYRGLVQLRLWLFKYRVFRETNAGVLVVSIGNLTVGGTGKTPVVEKLARAFQRRGRRVAILSRGYKSRKKPRLQRWIDAIRGKEYKPRIVSDGQAIMLDSLRAGDEPYMLAVNLRDVIVLVDKNRVASALYAVEKMGCDTLILDDGMQFLNLRHRVDLVLVDRQAPFGNEYLLPRGTLREPPENLKRAGYILITKSDPGGNGPLIERIRRFNRTAEIIECVHRPLYLQQIHTGEKLPLEWLRGKKVGAFSGIASPTSFMGAIRELGGEIGFERHFADHHRFTEREIQSFLDRCDRMLLDAVITTEKDSVRLPRIEPHKVSIYFLRVEIEILNGKGSWDGLVKRFCDPEPILMPQRFIA
jgi:tetraacyldisaccharide 4'-kinase